MFQLCLDDMRRAPRLGSKKDQNFGVNLKSPLVFNGVRKSEFSTVRGKEKKMERIDSYPHRISISQALLLFAGIFFLLYAEGRFKNTLLPYDITTWFEKNSFAVFGRTWGYRMRGCRWHLAICEVFLSPRPYFMFILYGWERPFFVFFFTIEPSNWRYAEFFRPCSLLENIENRNFRYKGTDAYFICIGKKC